MTKAQANLEPVSWALYAGGLLILQEELHARNQCHDVLYVNNEYSSLFPQHSLSLTFFTIPAVHIDAVIPFYPCPFLFSDIFFLSFSHSLQQHHRFLCSFLSLSFCLYLVRVMSVKCPAGFGCWGQKGQNLNSHLPPTGSDLSPNLTQSYHLVLWYSVSVYLSDVLLE